MDHGHLLHPFRVLFEEQIKGVKLLGDAFDVVEAVYANDIFHVWVLSRERCDARLDFRLLQTVEDLLWVKPDGEVACSDEVVAEGDTQWGFGQFPEAVFSS